MSHRLDVAGCVARSLGFAITVDTDSNVVRTIARTVARLGYRSLWVNTGDGEHADGLAVLREAHKVAPDLMLGVGVIALHRVSSIEIVDRVLGSGLPFDRLLLGIGSGTSPTAADRPVARVRAALTEIRTAMPEARVIIAALGPAMCRLGGELADGILLNWMPPSGVRWAHAEIDRGRASGARPGPGPAVLAYVRAATGPAAPDRITCEAARYRRAGTHYQRNAERNGAWLGGVDLDSRSAGAELASYRDVLDHVILRALTAGGTAAELEEIAAVGIKALAGAHDRGSSS